MKLFRAHGTGLWVVLLIMGLANPGCSNAPRPDPAMPPLPPLSDALRFQLDNMGPGREKSMEPAQPAPNVESKPRQEPSTGAYLPLITTMTTGFTTFGPTITTHENRTRQSIRAQQAQFVAENSLQLEQQIAQGGGDYVDALLQMFGCSGETLRGDRPMVVLSPLTRPPLRRRLAASILQESYPALYTQPAPSPEVLLVRMKVALAQDSHYKESCKYF